MNVDAQSQADVVLVVDDEPLVLSIVCCVLTNAGYTVLRAAGAAEALEIGRMRPTPIRLLVADVVMPGLSGPLLAEALAELHPETLCLFMAGLPDTPEVCDRILRRGLPFLAKPFVPKTLLNKVREVLAGAARSMMMTA